jgi:hypothetical protein
MLRPLAAAAAFACSLAAWAQTAITPQQVQLLAPHLVSFAGSSGNFAALVNGLSQGLPVTLLTPTADGQFQIVTFTPPPTASAAEIARALESARTSLIARGIAAPTAQQIAVALVGGGLPTPAGLVQVAGTLTGTLNANAVQVRTESPGLAGAGATFPAFAGTLPGVTRQGSSVTLSANNGLGPPVTFNTPGTPLSDAELAQSLSLAGQLLAQLGILNPTPEQLRAALIGGNVGLSNGSTLALAGLLQGRVRNTSESPILGTSNSPFVGNTSNTPPAHTGPSVTPPPSTATGVQRAGANTAPAGAAGAASAQRAR